ncbi:hypothetical protein [Candidatus Nitrosopumilus salaria]|nr:hypothetical protein [Candidatus Nitrosopumilus salaria]
MATIIALLCIPFGFAGGVLFSISFLIPNKSQNTNNTKNGKNDRSNYND